MSTPTNVKLVSVTPDAEQTMAYIARVSNPANQDNEKYAGLLKYCIKHNHWSVFEQSTMTLEIETTSVSSPNFAPPIIYISRVFATVCRLFSTW